MPPGLPEAFAWIGGCTLCGLLLLPVWMRLLPQAPARAAALLPLAGFSLICLLGQLLWRLPGLNPHPAWMWTALFSSGMFIWVCFGSAPLSAGTLHRVRGEAIRGTLLFALAFLFWAHIRGTDPGVTHTEQPMDAMWLRSTATSEQPPFADSWFAGEAATYYADGHHMMALLGRCFATPPALSVNLAQALLFALTVLLCVQIMKSWLPKHSILPAFLAVFLLLFSSSLPGVYDAWRHHQEHWWWWQASRILQDGETQLITEFPFFSFWLGDLHAHLIGLPLLLMQLYLAIQLKKRWRRGTLALAILFWVWNARVNPWQAPAALALLALPWVEAWLLRQKTPRLHPRDLQAFLPLLLLLPGRAPGLSPEIAFNRFGHSSPLDLMMLFGFLLPGLAGLRFGKRHPLVLTLLLLCCGMILTCEVLILKDVFQSRMNTVFKLYYQVWILLAALSAYGLSLLLLRLRLRWRILPLLLFAPMLLYSGRLISQVILKPVSSLHPHSVLSLDHARFLELADRIIAPGDLILEAPGSSYDAFSSELATWTAGHGLLGWSGHQVQWRPGVPQPDLSWYYEADPAHLQAHLLSKGIDWVLLSDKERNQFNIPPGWELHLQSFSTQVLPPPRALYRVDRP